MLQEETLTKELSFTKVQVFKIVFSVTRLSVSQNKYPVENLISSLSF